MNQHKLKYKASNFSLKVGHAPRTGVDTKDTHIPTIIIPHKNKNLAKLQNRGSEEHSSGSVNKIKNLKKKKKVSQKRRNQMKGVEFHPKYKPKNFVKEE